jgi:drug/metabolite transporter (DMT)-like permease
MERRDHIDAPGAAALVAFALLLAFNQVVVKVVNEGLQPAYFAALRSAGAAICVWLWIRYRGRRLDFAPGTIVSGIILGLIFATEFLGLFIALDLTTVTRTSVIFYSMPLWLSLAAHFMIPGERIHPAKALGLVAAFCGVAWAIIDRGAGSVGQASILGDLAALVGALGWAAVVLMARVSPLKRVRPEMQHFWQLAVSAPILFLATPLFGPLVRDLQPIHLWGLGFQIVIVVSAGFLFWLWLLTIYPASGVASFSFLSPIFGVAFGWLLLGEQADFSILMSGCLVALGILLINRSPPNPGRSFGDVSVGVTGGPNAPSAGRKNRPN